MCNMHRLNLIMEQRYFPLPLIFACFNFRHIGVKSKGSELQVMLGWRKLKAGENQRQWRISLLHNQI